MGTPCDERFYLWKTEDSSVEQHWLDRSIEVMSETQVSKKISSLYTRKRNEIQARVHVARCHMVFLDIV